MKILDVPTVSTTDVKKSPVKIAEMAAKLNTGVYVLNRGKALSVTVTPEQYRSLVEAQERLLELETESRAQNNLIADDGVRYTAEKVSQHGLPQEIDPDDGWE